jgi:hypothetical protein
MKFRCFIKSNTRVEKIVKALIWLELKVAPMVKGCG